VVHRKDAGKPARADSFAAASIDMDIGIKLDIGFSKDESARRLYGGDRPLDILHTLGFRAVETAVGPDTKFDALTAYTEMCSAAGLRVSIHPYTERTPCNPAYFSRNEELCRRFHTRVFLAAEEAARCQGCGVKVIVHGAACEKGQDRRALTDESIRFFSWAREWCMENAPEVKPVVELQFRPWPHETIQRIGDVYGEVAEIADRADVGICWDFGHAYMNADRCGLPLDPPEALWPRIVHIHCHDVNEIDHHPLVFNRVPWERMLTRALDRGFEGTVILEVPPQNFLAAGGLSSLTESIDKIKAISAARLGA
jgi:sugar phosphate isomerase/epimerase